MLEHVSFTARPGQTTAFIGSTGSGKSTLINLIPRFYDVTGGRVLVDGVDVRDIPQKELRDEVGYVPQKGLLFSGTIATNLRYGDEDAPDELLGRARTSRRPPSLSASWKRALTPRSARAAPTSRAASASAFPSRVRW